MSVLWDGSAPSRRQDGVCRRYDRVPADITVNIRQVGRTVRARAVNIGEGGLAVVSAVRFEPGQEIAIAFSLPDQTQIIEASAIVSYVKGYAHGLEFWAMAQECRDAVAAFVGQHLNGPSAAEERIT